MLLNRKVLLTQPVIAGSTQATPSVGLAFLATALRRRDYEVTVLDCVLEEFTIDDFCRYVERNEFAVVGIQLFSMDLASARAMIEATKRIRPQTITILGGPHPSCDPDDVLRDYPDVDYAIRGEGENALPELLDVLERGKPSAETLAGVPGLIFREAGETRANPPDRISDLDALGQPAWDLIDPRRYVHHENLWIFQKRPVVAPLHLVRGCPHQCTFCSAHTINGRRVRFRSVEAVVQEMRMLHDDYGVGEFHILDEFFTVKKRYVLDFCEALAREQLDVVWCCPLGVRLDSLDAELLHAMEGAGCYGSSVGIESGSQRILDFIRKGITLDLVREKVALIAKETSWLVQGFFILGLPTETREEIEATIDLACSLPLHVAAFSPFRVCKGTELYEFLKERGEVDKVDWSATTSDVIGYAPEGMTTDELAALRRKAYIRFYSRPWRALTLLLQLRYARQRKVLIQTARRRLFRSPKR